MNVRGENLLLDGSGKNQDDVIDLTLSIEDAFKVLISGGIVSPARQPTTPPLSLSKTYEEMTLEPNLPLEKASELTEKKEALISLEDDS